MKERMKEEERWSGVRGTTAAPAVLVGMLSGLMFFCAKFFFRLISFIGLFSEHITLPSRLENWVWKPLTSLASLVRAMGVAVTSPSRNTTSSPSTSNLSFSAEMAAAEERERRRRRRKKKKKKKKKKRRRKKKKKKKKKKKISY